MRFRNIIQVLFKGKSNSTDKRKTQVPDLLRDYYQQIKPATHHDAPVFDQEPEQALHLVTPQYPTNAQSEPVSHNYTYRYPLIFSLVAIAAIALGVGVFAKLQDNWIAEPDQPLQLALNNEPFPIYQAASVSDETNTASSDCYVEWKSHCAQIEIPNCHDDPDDPRLIHYEESYTDTGDGLDC